jgi:hypothetical protein
MKNIIDVGNRSNTYLQRYKNLFERQETRFICKFWSISLLLVRILKTDPDPGQVSQINAELGIHTDRGTLWVIQVKWRRVS